MLMYRKCLRSCKCNVCKPEYESYGDTVGDKRVKTELNRCMVVTKPVGESPVIDGIVHNLSKPKTFVKFKIADDAKEERPDPKLRVPMRNCIKIVEKEIKRVEAMKSEEFGCHEHERVVVRNVNFDANQKIYNNLLPLSVVKKKKSKSNVSCYKASVPSDQEPRLENFVVPGASEEFASSARGFRSVQTTAVEYYDGYVMDRRIRSWNRE